jgi:hypothetical protein
MFNRYMGVDYSGALTPTASLNGLRVYVAECDAVPAEVAPPPSLRKYWTRRGIAEWLRICAATHRLEDRMMRPHGKISARVLSMRGDARVGVLDR